jgi:hypothetical protein
MVMILCCCCWFILAVVFFVLLMTAGGDDGTTTTDALAEAGAPPAPVSPGSTPSPTLPPTVFGATMPPSTGDVLDTTGDETETPNNSTAPTDDPNKTFFPATGDTYFIADDEFADLSFGTSETLEVASSTNSSSVILLTFNWTELPPAIDSVLVESSIVLRLVHSGSLSNPAPSITVSHLSLQDDLDIETVTWNNVSDFLGEGLVEGPSTFTLSNETDVVDVDITGLLQSDIQLRRDGRHLQGEDTVVLVLRTNDDSNPLGEIFQSRESGEDFSPTIYHEYLDVTITSCDQNPCGIFAECWELDNGEVICECGNGDEVAFEVNCSEPTCLQDKIYSTEQAECVCPPEKPMEDVRGRCFVDGSKCLITGTPCRGVGSACYQDSVQPEGYACFCPDDSAVSGNEDCPNNSINSCFVPFNPCGSAAVCNEQQNGSGQVTEVFCQCVEASGSNIIVPFGQPCTSV